MRHILRTKDVKMKHVTSQSSLRSVNMFLCRCCLSISACFPGHMCSSASVSKKAFSRNYSFDCAKTPPVFVRTSSERLRLPHPPLFLLPSLQLQRNFASHVAAADNILFTQASVSAGNCKKICRTIFQLTIKTSTQSGAFGNKGLT